MNHCTQGKNYVRLRKIFLTVVSRVENKRSQDLEITYAINKFHNLKFLSHIQNQNQTNTNNKL